MNNDLITEKSWLKKYWKWLMVIFGILALCIGIYFSSGMDNITNDLANAYADTALYENALNKLKSSDAVITLIGDIQPIDKLAILEGQVQYSNNYNHVESAIRIQGTKGQGMMDITAYRLDNKWVYTKINFRIKNPPERKQTIEILDKIN